MPKLKTVIIASQDMHKPGQDHEELITWFDMPPRPDFFNWVYQKQKYDIFGILFSPFRFAEKDCLSKIVQVFNVDPEKILCIYSSESIEGKRCIFINKHLARMEHIDSLESIIDYASEYDYKVFSVKGLFNNGKA